MAKETPKKIEMFLSASVCTSSKIFFITIYFKFYAENVLCLWNVWSLENFGHKNVTPIMYLFFTKIIKFLLTYNCNFAYDCDTTDNFVKFYIYTINTV